MKKKPRNKKLIGELCLIVLLIVFVCVLLFNDRTTTPEKIWEAISTADYKYFAAAIITLILYTVLYSLSLVVISKNLKVEVKVGDLYLISTSEFFFNGITPMAVGGQPFQVFGYKQVNVEASKSTGIILMNFLASLASMVIVSLVSLSYYPLIVENCTIQMRVWFWVGFCINCAGFIIFTMLGASKFFRKIIVGFFNWICSWKIMRRVKGIDKKFEQYITNAQTAFKDAWKNKLTFVLAVLSKIIANIALFSIPFFILKALKLPVGHTKGMLDATMFFEILCLTSFIQITSNFIPTPGAAGGMEAAFKYFFLPIVIQAGSFATAEETATATAGVLLWRIVTYYLLMIYSFMCYVIFSKKKHSKYPHFIGDNKKENKEQHLEDNNSLNIESNGEIIEKEKVASVDTSE